MEEDSLEADVISLPRQVGRVLTRSPIGRDALAVLLSAALADGGVLVPTDLAAMPLILHEWDSNTRVVIDAWFRASGCVPKSITELSSVEAIKVMVGSGLGISVLPSMALTGGVVGAVVLLLGPPTTRELGLVMHQEKARVVRI